MGLRSSCASTLLTEPSGLDSFNAEFPKHYHPSMGQMWENLSHVRHAHPWAPVLSSKGAGLVGSE